MEETAEATPLPEDIVREILLRVPTDAAALFRCAATCKLWRAIVADLSFLRHHWPEDSRHPSSCLGFFGKRYDKREPPFFCPVSPGSVLGARRRHPLTSFVSGPRQGNFLNDAVPLAARGGLLLVGRLLAGGYLHLAVCDIHTGTCDVLPQLKCRVSRCVWGILTREDCCSPLHGEQGRTPLKGYSTFFKVLAILIGDYDQDCNLYTFSSSEPNWSEPRNCFDQVLRPDGFGVWILTGTTNRAIVCRGVAYWLGSYSTDQWISQHYFTFGVDVNTGEISFGEISIPANQLAGIRSFGLMLSVDEHGKLSLFLLQMDGLWLNTWTREDDDTWLLTRGIELKPPKQQVRDPVNIAMLSREKNGDFFMADKYGHVHKTDLETGVMEVVTTEISLGTMAVPVEIDWPALFMSRLAV